MKKSIGLEKKERDFLGVPEVKPCLFIIGSGDLILGRGAKIPHASGPRNQN